MENNKDKRPDESTGGKLTAAPPDRPTAVRRYKLTRERQTVWLDRNKSGVIRTDPPRSQKAGKKEFTRRQRRSAEKMYAGIIATASILLVLGCLALALNFFKVKSITLITECGYSEADIIRASGIEEGQKLITLGISGREKSVCSAFALIESCDIRVHPDGSVEISVSEYVPVIYTLAGDMYYSYTKELYCLESSDRAETFEEAGLIFTVLPEISRSVCGSDLELKDESGDFITTFIEEAGKAGILEDSEKIDFSDRYAIQLTDSSGTEIRLGSVSDLQNKFLAVSRVLEETEARANLNVDVSTPGQVYVKVPE